MSAAENYARDVYNLQNMYFKGAQARNKPADEALQTWWQKLQEFEGQPGYGAIPIDWADIWDRAQEKVRYTYRGTPGGAPGAAGRVRASAARRGVSDSPALETQISRLGQQEASDIRGLATTQALSESQYAERGRQNWLASLERLSGRRTNLNPPIPAFTGGNGDSGDISIPGLITGGLGAVGGAFAGPGGIALGASAGYAAGSGIESLFTGGGSDEIGQLLGLYGQGSGDFQQSQVLDDYLKRTTSIPGTISGTAGAAKPGIKGLRN